MKARSGFSLIDLLTTMVIIGILLALLVSGIGAAKELSYTAKCKSQMYQIGAAYTRLKTEQLRFRGEAGWVGELLAFADKNERLFACPNDEDVGTGQSSTVPGYIQTSSGSLIPLSKTGLRCRLSNRVTATTPGSYGLEIEDWVDWDWNDLRMLCEPLTNGGLKITAVVKSSSQHFALLDSNRRLIVSGFAPPKHAVLPGGSSESSYGINNYAKYFDVVEGADKIFAVEYHKVVANVVGPGAGDFWPAQAAPRHRGRMNVLFGDGHVETLDPSAIDPRVSQIYRDNWMPKQMP